MPTEPPTFEFEDALTNEGAQLIAGPIAGIDEAGRGPWAGPVVAAAVIIELDNIPQGLADSKTLSEKRRETIYDEIIAQCQVGVGVASVEEIDRINILQATFLAMARAEEALPRAPHACLVDGSARPKLQAQTHMLVKGDAKSLSIAAASIIAKVTRDRFMRDLAREFPFYGWEKNKGYGAPAHREGLERHGVTKHHRKSFAPIRQMIETARVA